jgi:hypothetical protein
MEEKLEKNWACRTGNEQKERAHGERYTGEMNDPALPSVTYIRTRYVSHADTSFI